MTTLKSCIDAMINAKDKKLCGKISDNQTLQPETEDFSINFLAAISNKSQRLDVVIGMEEVNR